VAAVEVVSARAVAAAAPRLRLQPVADSVAAVALSTAAVAAVADMLIAAAAIVAVTIAVVAVTAPRRVQQSRAR
jgi:hypothetical protein